MNWTLEAPLGIPLGTVNASTLVFNAWQIASGSTKKQVARYCLLLFVRHGVTFEPRFIVEVVQSSELVSDDRFWRNFRLDILVGLLTVISRTFVEAKKSQSNTSESTHFLDSAFVSQIVLAFWREGYRCMAIDPDFDFDSAVRVDGGGLLTSSDGHLIRKAITSWARLLELGFPLDASLADPLVVESVDAPESWRRLFQRFDDLFSFKPGQRLLLQPVTL